MWCETTLKISQHYIVPLAWFSSFCVKIKSVNHISVCSFVLFVISHLWQLGLTTLFNNRLLLCLTHMLSWSHTQVAPTPALSSEHSRSKKALISLLSVREKPFSCWKLKLNYLFPHSIFIALSWWKNNASSIRWCSTPTILLSCLFLPRSGSLALLWAVKCGQCRRKSWSVTKSHTRRRELDHVIWTAGTGVTITNHITHWPSVALY